MGSRSQRGNAESRCGLSYEGANQCRRINQQPRHDGAANRRHTLALFFVSSNRLLSYIQTVGKVIVGVRLKSEDKEHFVMKSNKKILPFITKSCWLQLYIYPHLGYKNGLLFCLCKIMNFRIGPQSKWLM